MRSLAAHFPPLGVFGALALIFTWPLPTILTSGVLGADAGDNLSVVWNFWWAQRAIASPDVSLFWTPALFAPIGSSLVTHTLTPLLTASTGLLAPWAEPLTRYNVGLLCSVFLNLAAAYAVAYAITRDRLAAVGGGVIFGGAPFLLVRLYGHLNVLSAWPLPLALIATLRYERKPGLTSALLLGGAIGLIAYVDYYYLIFAATLVAVHLWLSQRAIRIATHPLTSGRRRLLVAIAALIALVFVLTLWIEATGGVDATLAGIRLRMTETFNPRVALGFLTIAGLLAWKRPALAASRHPEAPTSRVWSFLPLVAGAAALLIGPVIAAAFQLWRAGDYVSQQYFWRSAPPGIDVATLVLGNPLGLLTGPATTAALERLAINRMENATWVGVVPVILFAFALRRLRSSPSVQTSAWIAGLFFVWSLGPYLRVLGLNTAFMLPQTLLRFVPLVSNARIPGRAFVVVQLMVAVLGAIALASLRRSEHGRALVLVALTAIVVEYWPRPHPWMRVETPPIYAMLQGQPPGVVLEIPVGIADGLVSRGRLGTHALFYQTVHEHPQMGGYLSRMSPRARASYESDPIVGRLLDLSEDLPAHAANAPTSPCQQSLACSVRYVVVDEETSSEKLRTFVSESFALSVIERDERRTLYRAERLRSCECAAEVSQR